MEIVQDTPNAVSLNMNRELVALHCSRFTMRYKSLANLRVALAKCALIKHGSSKNEADTKCARGERSRQKGLSFFIVA